MKDNKKLFMLLSILAAIALWLYVDNLDQSIGTTTVSNIPIEFVGENDVLAARDLMLIKAHNTTVTLELEGQRNIISRLQKKDMRVQVNLGTVTTAGTHSLLYEVIYPDSISRSSVTPKSASIYTVTVEIGQLYRRTVGIHGVIEGEVAEGYSAGDFQFDPNRLEVSGLEQDVQKVAYAQVTMQLDQSKETVVQSLPLELIGYDGEKITGLDLRLSHDSVTATLPISTIKELPLRVDFTESAGSRKSMVKCNIYPASIVVSGSAASLESLESILLTTIDLSQVAGDETRSVTIPLPADSVNLSGTTVANVIIDFQGVETKTLSTSNIGTSLPSAGYTASVISQSVTVTLRGPEGTLKEVDADHVRVVGDLSEVKNAVGTYTVPAKIYIDGAEDVGAIGSYEITVRISR